MSLQVRLDALITRIGTEFKTLRTLISGSGTGDVSALTTTATNLVAAINEVNSAVGGLTDTDALPEGSTNLYFTEARVLTSVLTGYAAGAGTVAATDSVLQAIQKIDGNTSAIINDGAAGSTTSTYSGSKIDADIAAAVAALVASSPAALDTLAELATALGNDDDFATTINTALGNRVRFDAAQTLTTPQQLQACNNIGVGDPETDLVALFNTAIS